jgi:hypothetical protein
MGDTSLMYLDVCEKILTSVCRCGCKMPVSHGLDKKEVHATIKEE